MKGLALAALVLVAGSGIASGADTLSRGALEAAFAGNTVVAADGTRVYYGPDGRFAERDRGGETPAHRRGGQWWADKGGLLCRKYPAGVLECARARQAGNRVTFVTVFGKTIGEAVIEKGKRLPGAD